MQSEKFDNRIKEAAEHHHPSYNEEAWNKMEQLLNKHLPQKKDDRRKYILILFLFLFTGGGLYLMISRPWKENKQANIVPAKAITEDVPVNSSPIAESKKDSDKNINNKKDIRNVFISGNDDNRPVVSHYRNQQPGHSSFNKQIMPVPDNSIDKDIVSKNDKSLQKNDINDKDDKMVKTKNDNKVDQVNKIQPDKIKEQVQEIAADKADPVQKANDAGVQIPEEKKGDNKIAANKKEKAKKRNVFFFSLSAGADISSIQFQEKGKLKPVTGVGAGYTIAGKFTLRTGFYTARKIYSAGKQYYKPASLPMNWNYLSQIDADCKVYEVPLTLSYNFGFLKKHNWFASSGLSSYFMKKEKYKYEYVYPSGTSYSYTHTVNNENKHYFSILTLSGGYTRKISNRLSLTAEPYIKIPLTGIGYGNVKLNSAGLLFSASFNPFNVGKK